MPPGATRRLKRTPGTASTLSAFLRASRASHELAAEDTRNVTSLVPDRRLHAQTVHVLLHPDPFGCSRLPDVRYAGPYGRHLDG